jgi:uncharacterized protein YjeT (DUF2065 family)
MWLKERELNITVLEELLFCHKPKIRTTEKGDKIMELVIQIIGIVFVLVAIVYFLKPDALKGIMEFFKQGKRIYLAGLIRLALAIVFLLAARQCGLPWVIVVFGILFLISGILIFLLGPEKCKAVIDWYQKQSLLLLRIIALVMLAIGAVIIYSA